MIFKIYRRCSSVCLLRILKYGQAFLIVLLGILAIGSSTYADGGQTYSPRTLVNSKWGPGSDEFGLIKGIEMETQGPLTFSLDRRGNIYIFDSVKNSIKKFSAEGTYLATLGSDTIGSAMAVDDEDHIFVLEVHKNKQIVHEYSPAGDLIKNNEISKDLKLAEMIMIDDSGDLFVNKDQKIYKIGAKTKHSDNTEGSTLSLLDQKQQLDTKKYGIPGTTKDKRFQVRGKNQREAVLRVLSNEGALLKEISIMPGSFLGQDDQGLVYIQGGSTKEHACEVRSYDLEGNVAAVIEIPHCYDNYTTIQKILDLDNYGNIYQMLTTPNGVQLIKWQQK